MAFSLLLNLFLAIVIDSCAPVQDKGKGCNIWSTTAWDLYAPPLVYPGLARLRDWPPPRTRRPGRAGRPPPR
jgi:hypothetical protein